MVTSVNVANKYYVYILRRPNGEPFYVGMGSGSRIDYHEKIAARGHRSHRSNVIRQIWSGGGSVQKEIYVRCATDIEAKSIEKELIKRIGRRDLGTGPLVNLTDGGDGVTGWSKELRETHGARTSAGMQNPVVLGKCRDHLRQQWEDPVFAEKHRRRTAAFWRSEEVRREQSERTKKHFSDPEVRRERAARIAEAHARPETKARNSAAAKKRMAAPGRREAHSAMARRLWATPGYAEKRRATFAAKREAKRSQSAKEAATSS